MTEGRLLLALWLGEKLNAEQIAKRLGLAETQVFHKLNAALNERCGHVNKTRTGKETARVPERGE